MNEAATCGTGVDGREYNYPDGNNGLVYWQVDQYGIFQAGTVVVWMNNYYPLDTAHLRMAACHELGHAIGMDHNPDTNSCMQATINGTGQIPNASDVNMLAWIYRW